VVGTINIKQAPILKRIYDQMADPKWVIAYGVCASSGGFYDNYATLQGIDRIIPVDIYIPGCPPRPEALLYGCLQLKKLISETSMIGSDRKTLYVPPVLPEEWPLELLEAYGALESDATLVRGGVEKAEPDAAAAGEGADTTGDRP